MVEAGDPAGNARMGAVEVRRGATGSEAGPVAATVAVAVAARRGMPRRGAGSVNVRHAPGQWDQIP